MTMARFERGKRYRATFFKTHYGFFHKWYFCAYCGKLIPRKKVEVDHWIPVGKARRTAFAKFLMYINGIFTINDTKNLLASCSRCNSEKSDKMKVWLFKGWLGRSYPLWILRKLLRCLLILFALYVMLTLLLSVTGNAFGIFSIAFWRKCLKNLTDTLSLLS